MNNTEMQYMNELELRKKANEIISWYFEPIKLKLADNTYYTPDFMVILSTHIEFHEVKGFWRDDARVKFKVASELYPYFKFVCIRKSSRGFIEE